MAPRCDWQGRVTKSSTLIRYRVRGFPLSCTRRSFGCSKSCQLRHGFRLKVLGTLHHVSFMLFTVSFFIPLHRGRVFMSLFIAYTYIYLRCTSMSMLQLAFLSVLVRPETQVNGPNFINQILSYRYYAIVFLRRVSTCTSTSTCRYCCREARDILLLVAIVIIVVLPSKYK